MQKEKTIRQLYYGNIQPSTKSIVAGSAFQKAQFRFSDLVEELLNALNDKEKVLLEELIDTWNEINCISSEEFFVDGFKLGTRLTLDVFEPDGGQVEPIDG